MSPVAADTKARTTRPHVGASPASRRPVAIGLAAVLLLPLAACADPTFPADDAACLKALDSPDAVDAFEWLAHPSGGEKHLGDLSTDQGLAFAHELQARGARSVRAFGIGKRQGLPPSESAEGLVVTLPDDVAGRRRLFQAQDLQLRARGFHARADEGQKYLMFPWKP